MSMRRSVKVLAIAMLGALCAAPAASAKTKTVVAGGPPPFVLPAPAEAL